MIFATVWMFGLMTVFLIAAIRNWEDMNGAGKLGAVFIIFLHTIALIQVLKVYLYPECLL